MSELTPHDPRLDPTVVDPLLLELAHRQASFGETVDTWVKPEPVEGWMVDIVAEQYGLEPGKYDAYISSSEGVRNEGSFAKFVAKDDPLEVVRGIAMPSIGGNMAERPIHQVYSIALHGNGDLTGSLKASNGVSGEKVTYFHEPGTNAGKDDGYKYMTYDMSNHGKALAGKIIEARSAAETSPKPGLLRRMGRAALRHR